MKQLFLRNIKKGFATNSSSYHSTLIFTKEEYDKWKKGELNSPDIDITYQMIKSDDYDEETGFYYYIESEGKRTINGQSFIAITYCKTNEM